MGLRSHFFSGKGLSRLLSHLEIQPNKVVELVELQAVVGLSRPLGTGVFAHVPRHL